MSQEQHEVNRPSPAWEEPAVQPAFEPLPDVQPQISDPSLPEVLAGPPASSQPMPAALPGHAAERARQERLRRLRELRQQSARLPEFSRYQRQGIPPPPSPPPSLKALLKHWWEHGPFASPTPGAPAARKPPKIPVGIGEARPLERRVRAWIARGQRELPRLFARVQKTVQPGSKMQMGAPAGKGPKRAQEARIIPGLIVLGFDFTVSREAAAQIMASVGGKPLRYKAEVHQFQVAVPPGQEAAFVARYRQVPGVIYADFECPPEQ